MVLLISSLISASTVHITQLYLATRSEDGEDLLCGGFFDVGRDRLDVHRGYFAVVYDDSVSLGTRSAEKRRCIKDETDSGAEYALVIGDKVDGGSTTSQIGFPCFHNKYIVDGDDVDVLYTFGLELFEIRDVSRNLLATRTGKRSGYANNDALAGKISQRERLLRVVFFHMGVWDCCTRLDLSGRQR